MPHAAAKGDRDGFVHPVGSRSMLETVAIATDGSHLKIPE
jgi:hypothetical protein